MTQTISLFIANLTIGGAERVVVNLSKGLSNEGYDVDIVLVEKKGKLLSDVPKSVNIVELGVDRVRYSAIPLARYFRSKQPKVFISFLTGSNVMATLGHLFAGKPSNLIVTEHNTQTMKQDTSSNRDRTLAKYLYPYADHIVGVSEGVSENVSEWANVDRSAITTIYNPVIDDDFIDRKHEKPDCEWFDLDVPIILSAGRHVEQKDYQTLIRAFDQLLSQRDARLIILGEGELTSTYKSLTDRLGISNEVSFPGFVDNPYSYMNHSDVFVLSSRWEGLSLVLIESMACETPVVSTDCPSGPSEVLTDGEYGDLVPVGEPELLKNALVGTLKDPTDKKILRRRARDFSTVKAVREYKKLCFNT